MPSRASFITEINSIPTKPSSSVSASAPASVFNRMIGGRRPALDTVALSTVGLARSSPHQDQLAQYLSKPLTNTMGLIEYWRLREPQWPQLVAMAYNFLSIPAMSLEYERVFSSCGLNTTLHASNLSGELLWHQEYLSNWSR